VTFDTHLAIQILPLLLRGLVVTIEATVAGFVFALAGGLVLAVGYRAESLPARAVSRSFVEFLRNTPLLVQLYFLFYGLPLIGIRFSTLLTGVLGLGIYYSAYIAEVYRGGVDAVPRGQWEAAQALRFSRAQTWRRIILPQAIPPVIPVLGNYLIGMFKETPLLAMITIPELLSAARQVTGMTYRYTEPYTMVALIFLAISYPTSLLFRHLERKLGTS
jgi:polar amino acid transport system permease protein